MSARSPTEAESVNPEHIGISVEEGYASELKTKIATILNHKPDSFAGSQPVSFEKHHLEALEKEDYFVCEKSDGVRYMLLLMVTPRGPAGFMIDRKNIVHYVDLQIPLPQRHPNDPVKFHNETLIDGELVVDVDDSKRVMRYLAFDLMAANSTSLVQRSYSTRLGILQQDVVKQYQLHYRNNPHLKSPFRLKWKSPEQNTADFKIKVTYNADRKPQYQLLICKNGSHVKNDVLTPDAELLEKWRHESPDGKIGEFRWDPDWKTLIMEEGYAAQEKQGGWRFVRFREDKATANDINVLERIKASIHDGVTIEMLESRLESMRAHWKAREKGLAGPIYVQGPGVPNGSTGVEKSDQTQDVGTPVKGDGQEDTVPRDSNTTERKKSAPTGSKESPRRSSADREPRIEREGLLKSGMAASPLVKSPIEDKPNASLPSVITPPIISKGAEESMKVEKGEDVEMGEVEPEEEEDIVVEKGTVKSENAVTQPTKDLPMTDALTNGSAPTATLDTSAVTKESITTPKDDANSAMATSPQEGKPAKKARKPRKPKDAVPGQKEGNGVKKETPAKKEGRKGKKKAEPSESSTPPSQPSTPAFNPLQLPAPPLAVIQMKRPRRLDEDDVYDDESTPEPSTATAPQPPEFRDIPIHAIAPTKPDLPIATKASASPRAAISHRRTPSSTGTTRHHNVPSPLGEYGPPAGRRSSLAATMSSSQPPLPTPHTGDRLPHYNSPQTQPAAYHSVLNLDAGYASHGHPDRLPYGHPSQHFPSQGDRTSGSRMQDPAMGTMGQLPERHVSQSTPPSRQQEQQAAAELLQVREHGAPPPYHPTQQQVPSNTAGGRTPMEYQPLMGPAGLHGGRPGMVGSEGDVPIYPNSPGHPRSPLLDYRGMPRSGRHPSHPYAVPENKQYQHSKPDFPGPGDGQNGPFPPYPPPSPHQQHQQRQQQYLHQPPSYPPAPPQFRPPLPPTKNGPQDDSYHPGDVQMPDRRQNGRYPGDERYGASPYARGAPQYPMPHPSTNQYGEPPPPLRQPQLPGVYDRQRPGEEWERAMPHPPSTNPHRGPYTPTSAFQQPTSIASSPSPSPSPSQNPNANPNAAPRVTPVKRPNAWLDLVLNSKDEEDPVHMKRNRA
ncbi:Dcp1p-Dcp2p decapping enzyme complex alpha subunit [Rhizophlyctis rosea]|nr:Dcp1p-Dcp2p decapping enzyme complex alpha subunit [Rhizophlyctis rosea]